MALYIDVPTPDELARLLGTRRDGCVSIYVPTSPLTQEADAGRIEFKNLTAAASEQLTEGGADKAQANATAEALEDLADDELFWARQAHSLAVFATEEGARAFRLPNRLTATVEVSDRFHVKPLLRAVTFPQAAFVLALSQNGARLLEVAPDVAPEEVAVPGMPAHAEAAVGKASVGHRSAYRRIQGDEGKKVRLRQYARRVEEALRPVLSGRRRPLILAATEPLGSIFRGVCTFPHLAEEVIGGNPDEVPDAELASRSREVLDGIYAAELAEVRGLYEQRVPQGRASDEITTIARAATAGAVDTVFVDIDETVPGRLDPETGAVTLDEADDASSYGVLDEIARRVLLNGGRVLAVRRDDIPGGSQAAAILRYPV
ncbi:MAG: baeRF11 domain-containing protein [Solirubrobacterales bacterium]